MFSQIIDELERLQYVVTTENDDAIFAKPLGYRQEIEDGELKESICVDRFQHKIKNPNRS